MPPSPGHAQHEPSHKALGHTAPAADMVLLTAGLGASCQFLHTGARCTAALADGFTSAPPVQGSDDVTLYGQRDHEAYRGDRTKEALLDFADSLAPSAGQPHHFIRCCWSPCRLVWSFQRTMALYR